MFCRQCDAEFERGYFDAKENICMTCMSKQNGPFLECYPVTAVERLIVESSSRWADIPQKLIDEHESLRVFFSAYTDLTAVAIRVAANAERDK